MALGHVSRVIWGAFCLSNTSRLFSGPVFCQCKGVKTESHSRIFRFLSCLGRSDWLTLSVPALWLPSLSTFCHLCECVFPTCQYVFQYTLGNTSVDTQVLGPSNIFTAQLLGYLIGTPFYWGFALVVPTQSLKWKLSFCLHTFHGQHALLECGLPWGHDAGVCYRPLHIRLSN